MAGRKRFAVVLGTRPEFIKLSAFLRRAPLLGIDTFVLHTGQHFDDNMSSVFFRELGLPDPDTTLGRFTTIGAMVADITGALEGERGRLDGVIVLGDTYTTLAGALAAVRVKLPLIHIEGGLRSGDRRMPEEMNRIIVDSLSDLIFVTEQSGVDNLLREGIPEERIHLVGNIGIESLEEIRASIQGREAYKRFGLAPRGYWVATVHRQEHTHVPKTLERISTFLSRLSEEMPIIFPLHPATRAKLAEYELEHSLTVPTVEPLGYLDFMSLVENSAGVLTDSGGIQEEAAHLGIPCCTLRDTTERPVTIEYRSNRLFPPSELDGLREEVRAHLSRTDLTPGAIPLWDSSVSERIIRHLA